MPKYRHDAASYLIERAKTQGFDGVTKPSTTSIATRVAPPFDPQTFVTPVAADIMELLYHQTGDSFVADSEVSTAEYGDIARNDDTDSNDSDHKRHNVPITLWQPGKEESR